MQKIFDNNKFIKIKSMHVVNLCLSKKKKNPKSNYYSLAVTVFTLKKCLYSRIIKKERLPSNSNPVHAI